MKPQQYKEDVLMSEQYVIVTAISTFRHRYCIPMSELQQLNQDMVLNDALAVEWAEDCVTCEDVEEFSQVHLGEQIIDTMIVDEAEAVQYFDRDNDYLADWGMEKKIKYMHNWKINSGP